MNNSQLKLAVVIPLANEEETIFELLTQVLVQIKKNDKIFCVLDNASKDNTKNIIQEYSKKDSRINLIWAPENTCVVDAYIRGYKEALASDCDWILEMDGGFSHDPKMIPSFLKEMEKKVDFVCGSRFCKGGRYSGSIIRHLISRGGHIVSNLFLRTSMTDLTSGYECFTRKALNYVLKKGIKSKRNYFQTEIRYHLSKFNWIEVPITYKPTNGKVGSGAIFESFICLRELIKDKKIINE